MRLSRSSDSVSEIPLGRKIFGALFAVITLALNHVAVGALNRPASRVSAIVVAPECLKVPMEPLISFSGFTITRQASPLSWPGASSPVSARPHRVKSTLSLLKSSELPFSLQISEGTTVMT
ncbi:hypothetical protein FA13DRAFT_37147 [Coprinellus micaceus]|uniref:Uncharacterized protein n=1 Tax=Coprinellus micaceus TaxID=71717 RepID=A0A4Y7U259_COPMI|nr:hypothetical protein FA13DRAFT_37147 [Coprinellus micaceus]